MPAPTYVSGTSFANGILNVTSAPLTRPATATTGDFLLAFVSISHTGTITPPAGWAEFTDNFGENTVLTLQTRVYQRRIIDIFTEAATYTWTFGSAACTAVLEVWRGVGYAFRARQDADLLSLFAHDTDPLVNDLPEVVAVSCFTGMSLLALGWAPQVGDTSRFNVTGGLIILLNVSMLVADSAPVPPGTVSRTATTLSTVQGLSALILLAPLAPLSSPASGGLAPPMTEQSRFAASFLTTEAPDAVLDLDDCVGQRQATFRFDLVNIITGYRTELHPRRDSVPVLRHDTTRTITRTLSGLWFDKADTARLNTISARIEPFMLIGGGEYPLGQFMFSDQSRPRYTSGVISTGTLYDNSFIVDQQIEHSFPRFSIGLDTIPVDFAIRDLLTGLPIVYTLEVSPYNTVGAWAGGTSRGLITEELSIDGDYFSPWFDHTNVMRFIRAFDPADAIPTFDLDEGNKVFYEPPPLESDTLLTAPNRFVVISNGTLNGDPGVGTYDVPSSAPHSIANRGFVLPQVENRQVENAFQAGVIARNLGLRQTIYEQVELVTAPDPRYDSYDVIRWQGENWLETAWTLPLLEGSQMTHTARKAYTS